MFATRRLVFGDLILEENPVMIVPFGSMIEGPLYEARLYDFLNFQFDTLEHSTQVNLRPEAISLINGIHNSDLRIRGSGNIFESRTLTSR